MKPAKKRFVVAVLVLPMLVASAAFTQNAGTNDDHELNLQAYVELLRADVKAKRVAIITEIMQFNDTEAATFWPIFRQYDADLTSLGDGRVKLIEDYIKNYDNITNEKSDELMSKAFELEGQRAALKKKYFDKMKTALSARTAARFFQVENQMQHIVDLQISANLPTMQ
jgi:hypothetical protein